MFCTCSKHLKQIQDGDYFPNLKAWSSKKKLWTKRGYHKWPNTIWLEGSFFFCNYIYMYEYRSKGPCVECSMRWPFVCQNDLWRKLKVEFAKVFFCESFAKVVRYDWNWLEHTWIFWRWCLYTAIFRESLAKVLIKLGERRPSLAS